MPVSDNRDVRVHWQGGGREREERRRRRMAVACVGQHNTKLIIDQKRMRVGGAREGGVMRRRATAAAAVAQCEKKPWPHELVAGRTGNASAQCPLKSANAVRHAERSSPVVSKQYGGSRVNEIGLCFYIY